MNLDLPSAYASTLGAIRYGGSWVDADELPRGFEAYWEQGELVFVHCKVAIPDLSYGPLPRTLRRTGRSYMESLVNMASGWTYPSGATLTGTWTWDEIREGLAVGCRLVKMHRVWVHRSRWQPFLPWWERIQEGRAAGGVAGQLAKMTGNALWGKFAMDPKNNGSRTIVTPAKGGGAVARRLHGRPYGRPAFDLAEAVAGVVRGRLFAAMTAAGDNLISAHTDGLWIHPTDDIESYIGRVGGWREKTAASRLEVLTPQCLRYWPTPVRPGAPFTVYAGVPAKFQHEQFAIQWADWTATGGRT